MGIGIALGRRSSSGRRPHVTRLDSLVSRLFPPSAHRFWHNVSNKAYYSGSQGQKKCNYPTTRGLHPTFHRCTYMFFNLPQRTHNKSLFSPFPIDIVSQALPGSL